MGVSYRICCSCEDIFEDCEIRDWCEGCNSSWCYSCMNDISKFEFNGYCYCDLCWKDTVPEYTDTELLDIALEKLNTTRKKLKLQLPEKVPKHHYYCWNPCMTNNITDENHVCGNTNCKQIGKNYYDVDDNDDDDIPLRGICCIKKSPENTAKWCSECYHAYYKVRAITWVLCMKTTKILPKDLTIMIGKLILRK